ncbi:DUF6153 family protein [Streptomyces zinciresistens]|uniref:DUF6153 family protein n=1 Tax=Streptomyces zinciresistens TaxID=1073330 RepID=UPI000A307336|nr:DUF6153 family protein [Streptomyces zinciresistens]
MRVCPAGRRPLLLILALLTGLLAMHGLAPAVVPMGGAGMSAHSATVPADIAPVHQNGDGCQHANNAGAGGNMEHADPTCAAPRTGVTYTPPALALASAPHSVSEVPSRASAAGSAEGRAPPDLAQLQLLRI